MDSLGIQNIWNTNARTTRATMTAMPTVTTQLRNELERRGGLVHVRWGAAAGWIPVGSVRLIGPDTTR